MQVKLISNTERNGEMISPEQIIVQIARVSSSRTDKTEDSDKLLSYLIKNKHWSPFEMVGFCVEIVTSKAIAIQLLRHRSFSFQEFSQRYAKVENIEPFELREQAITNRQSSTEVFDPYIEYYSPNSELLKGKASELVEFHLVSTENIYNKLLNAGVAKECARMVLPMATQTTLYMNGTVRSWIHFLSLRDDPHAQKEAQLIAKEIKKIFIENFPSISKALEYTI